MSSRTLRDRCELEIAHKKMNFAVFYALFWKNKTYMKMPINAIL